MKTAVIYARYSSAGQTEQSIEGQLRVCHEFAQRNELVIVEEYIDRAMTGTNDNRIDFQRMMKDSDKKAWDYVLVYKLDRFSRNKYETAKHKKHLKDNGIKLLSAMENIPDTPEGIILESLLEGMAEYYSAELSQKVKRGLNESRLKGNFTGGYVMFGYQTIDNGANGKKLIIKEDEANIVRQVFNDYLSGRLIVDILKELREKGITNKGKPFSRTYLYKLFANEKYAGLYHYNGQLYTNIYPQIVPVDIFNKAHTKLKNNKYGKHIPEIVYLLKNKVICGHCGNIITSGAGTSRDGTVNRYYNCSGRYKSVKCNKKAIRKDILENVVIDSIISSLSSNSIVTNIADKILEKQKQILEDKSTLNLLLYQKKEIDTSIENIMSAIEKGVVTNTTKTRLEELENKQNELNEKIILETTRNTCAIRKEEIIKYFQTTIKKEPVMLIDLLVKKVVLYDDKIEIYLNYTEKTDGNDHQPFSFYTTNKDYEININSLVNKKSLISLDIKLFI